MKERKKEINPSVSEEGRVYQNGESGGFVSLYLFINETSFVATRSYVMLCIAAWKGISC